MSFEGGYQSDVVQSSNMAQGGAIFITNIEAQEATENVASKVFTSDGLVLQSCSSSTDLITVSVLAITGFSTFKPIVMIESQLVTMIQDEDQNVWTGTIDLDLNGKSFVEAVHNDGAFHRCMITTEANPVVTNAFLAGDYPNGQTELKENDAFSLQVEGSEQFVKVEVDNYGAAKGKSYSMAASTSASIDLIIANKGNSSTSLGVKLRIENSNGTKSDWFITDSGGAIDGLNTVVLNNTKPSISIQELLYPENQFALKNEEKAIVKHEISNYDSVSYSSENGQLNISEPNLFSSTKEVRRNAGEYNISIHNLKITANRSANGSSIEANMVVQIANKPAILSFNGNERRLVSGGNNGTAVQRHQLSIQSDQKMIGVPQLSVEQGTLEKAATQLGDSNNYEQTIVIHDNDLKGIHQAQLIKATNLAGIETTAFEQNARYTLGGFVRRILSFQEFSNEAALGTQISDAQKLVAQDKDERLMTYVPSFQNIELAYTIVEPSNIPNPLGNIFHWNDEQAVNNNSTGLATVAIEELP
ncbi:MAG: hypothetical protein RJQ00_06495 [Vicingaceae bacterium]